MCFLRAGCLSCCRAPKPGTVLVRAEASGPRMCELAEQTGASIWLHQHLLGGSCLCRCPSPGSTALPWYGGRPTSGPLEMGGGHGL